VESPAAEASFAQARLADRTLERRSVDEARSMIRVAPHRDEREARLLERRLVAESRALSKVQPRQLAAVPSQRLTGDKLLEARAIREADLLEQVSGSR
jgi:hypothetical protein